MFLLGKTLSLCFSKETISLLTNAAHQTGSDAQLFGAGWAPAWQHSYQGIVKLVILQPMQSGFEQLSMRGLFSLENHELKFSTVQARLPRHIDILRFLIHSQKLRHQHPQQWGQQQLWE